MWNCGNTGKLSINIWAKSSDMAPHLCIITAWSLFKFSGICWSTCLLMIYPNLATYLSFCIMVRCAIILEKAPSCSWIAGRRCCQRQFQYHSSFLDVFSGCHSLDLEATPHRNDGSAHLFFYGHFFWMLEKLERDSSV